MGAPARLALALPLVLVALPARAGPFKSTVGELFAAATRIEVVRVVGDAPLHRAPAAPPAATSPAVLERAGRTSVIAEVVESIRGRPVGTRAELDAIWLPKPAAGTELLVICTKEVCP